MIPTCSTSLEPNKVPTKPLISNYYPPKTLLSSPNYKTQRTQSVPASKDSNERPRINQLDVIISIVQNSISSCVLFMPTNTNFLTFKFLFIAILYTLACIYTNNTRNTYTYSHTTLTNSYHLIHHKQQMTLRNQSINFLQLTKHP